MYYHFLTLSTEKAPYQRIRTSVILRSFTFQTGVKTGVRFFASNPGNAEAVKTKRKSMLIDDLTDKPYPLTKKLTRDLREGAYMLHDDIMEAMECLPDNKNLVETQFYHMLPRAVVGRLDARLCSNFLHALEMLTFKMFCPMPMRLGCTAEELLLDWIVKNAKVCRDLEKPGYDDEYPHANS